MTLAEWLKAHERGSVSELSRLSGVSMLTIRRVRDGLLLRNTEIAKKLSRATGGDVDVQSMLDLDCIESPGHDSSPPGAP